MTEVCAPGDISIVPFERQHAAAFRDLNIAWIERYFAVEDKDREVLQNPHSRIIDIGGAILIARNKSGEVIGCAALVPVSEGVLELVKMAVADNHQRRGIGGMLIDAAILKAREIGARSLYLESNSKLGSAIRLYERAGFEHLPPEQRPYSPYARCNIYMSRSL